MSCRGGKEKGSEHDGEQRQPAVIRPGDYTPFICWGHCHVIVHDPTTGVGSNLIMHKGQSLQYVRSLAL